MPFHVIAHRGASGYAPENSLPAFRVAAELGVREVELDVQVSSDDVLILFHDDVLDDKTNGNGAVRDHTAADVTRFDIGSWFDANHPGLSTQYAGTTLATLAEVFDRFGARFHYHVELKASDSQIPELTLAEVERAGLAHHVTLTSFHLDQLTRVRELDSSVPICLLVKSSDRLRRRAAPDPDLATLDAAQLRRHWIDLAVDGRFQQVGFPVAELDRELVRYARERGLEIRAWRVRSDDDVERAIRMGANGMTTNWPDRLQERIEREP